MLKNFLIAAVISVGLSGSFAQAQTCGGNYTVKSGDSLSKIAKRLYSSADMWSAIYNSNQEVIGASPSHIQVGMKLRISCINGRPTGLDGGVDMATMQQGEALEVAPGTAANRQIISFLMADDYKPFMDRALPNGGLLTDVVNKAMLTVKSEDEFGFFWINDNDAHLEPLLSNAFLDLGVGWFQPDCDANPDAYRCENFYFSDSTFEVLILLFVNKDTPFTFAQDSDIIGKTLCRPSGYFTHDLDKNGRNWLVDNKITLESPTTVKGCFDMLMAGEVDAVAINEFTGREALKDLNLKDRVTIIDTRPLSIEGQLVIVHKSHPRGQELLAILNEGIRNIKASGEYQSIIDTHMSRVWADF
ncbi:MAG: transporter substrate-binding domain-containing protein [Paracoccaceae bacterium]